eukprot:g3506.t1
MERILRLALQLTSNENEINSLPLPPIAQLEEGMVFPTFPQMKKDAEKLGGVFTYALLGKRRLTIFADPATFPIIFHPGEYGETEGVGDAVRMEMDKIAHAWFGIPKEVCPWTRDGLNALRLVLSPSNSARINEVVGKSLRDSFDAFSDRGTIPLVKLASMTFAPVNAALFGDKNVPPEAEAWFHTFDENLPMIVRGVPMTAFEDTAEAYGKIVLMFQNAIEKIRSGKGIVGEHFAPAIVERIAVLNAKAEGGKDFSSRVLAQFMVSIFWAPQANTLPMTSWILAHVLDNKRVYSEVAKEVRSPKRRFGVSSFDASPESLPYTNACLRETLRLYIANMTHRTVTKDIKVTDASTGRTFRVPQGDMLSLASYIQHYNSKVYPNPEEFRPERWVERGSDGEWRSLSNPTGGCPLGSKKHAWYPFSKGRFSCSGQHLAKLEIPTLVALFIQRFDADIDHFPDADWDDVVASVRPEGWPYDVPSYVSFRRRGDAREWR